MATQPVPPTGSLRDPKRRRPLAQRLYLSFWKRLTILSRPGVALLRLTESIFGPSGVVVLLLPVIWSDIVRRLVDYPAFKRLRRILPDSFWGGWTPWRHFVRMIRNWSSLMAFNFLCDRLAEPAWEKRAQVTGPALDLKRELNQRPIIMVHLHIGGYGVLNRWLRAHRYPATPFRSGHPDIFNHAWADRIFDAADRQAGLQDVPQIFLPGDVRPMMRFLVPGHILTVAIDAETETSDIFDAGGHPICLSQGIVRLAAASNALLVPVSVLPRGLVRYEFRFGTPVPDDLVDGKNPRPAIQYLLDRLWKDVQEDPSVLGWSTLLTLDLRSKPNHVPWP